MKTREEILRLYQEHFGNNHEAGVFAVYDAGVVDGRAVREALDTPKAKTPPPIAPTTGTGTTTLVSPDLPPTVVNTTTGIGRALSDGLLLPAHRLR